MMVPSQNPYDSPDPLNGMMPNRPRHRARCIHPGCGWIGPARLDMRQAHADARAHTASVHPGDPLDPKPGSAFGS